MTSQSVARSGFHRFELTDRDFSQIAQLAYNDFGLSLSDTKKSMVYSRLVKRVRALQLQSFSEYCSLLTSPSGARERSEMLCALTTNVTHFFREGHHFDLLAHDILPDLLQRAERGMPIRIWSAGCSSGLEPYSIAMTILHKAPEAGSLDIKIAATDVDPDILKQAQRAEYEEKVFDPLPPDMRQSLTVPGQAGHLRPSPAVRAMVTFSKVNLVKDWDFPNYFDVIFCRNVAIYFDARTQAKLWSRLSQTLSENGTLFIGHSERLDPVTASKFRKIAVTAFRKTNAEAATSTPQKRAHK